MTLTPTTALVVPTPYGPARLHVDDPAGDPVGPGGCPGRLVLGHGAGGGVDAPDLLAARAAARSLGLQVVRVEQPWRVRGARVAEAPARLDVAWVAALDALDALAERADPADLAPVPTVLGGRSSGARVACRTAALLPEVRGVLCLAFPLVPPGSARSRAEELSAPRVPRLVVQGSRDAFGVPEAGPGVQVDVVAGADHGFAVRRADGRTRAQVLQQVTDLVARWLVQVLPELRGQTLT